MAFHRALFLRTLAYLAAGLALCIGLVVTTDEPGSTLGLRAARVAGFMPVLSAVAVLGALGTSRARGELRALEALGAPPGWVSRGALAAGWLAGALAVGLLLWPGTDVRSLFPALPRLIEWTEIDGQLVALGEGVRVLGDGSIVFDSTRAQPTATVPLLSELRTAALWAFGPWCALLPPWCVLALRWQSRLLSLLLAGAGLVFGLHAVAAERVPAVVLLGAATPFVLQLLAGVVLRRTS